MAKKKEIDIALVEQLAAQGMTHEQIAYRLGISRGTLYNHKASNDDILDAIKRGQAAGIEKITNALFDNALDGNTAAQIFFLKNRAGWADKQETEHTGELVVKWRG